MRAGCAIRRGTVANRASPQCPCVRRLLLVDAIKAYVPRSAVNTRRVGRAGIASWSARACAILAGRGQICWFNGVLKDSREGANDPDLLEPAAGGGAHVARRIRTIPC